MTFREKYRSPELTWHAKTLVMEIYHLTMRTRDKGWTVKKTSDYFGVSVGLVSENLRIADALHINPELMKCVSRQEVLDKIK